MKVQVPFGFDSVGHIEVEASNREEAFEKAREIIAEADLSELVSMAEPLWGSVDTDDEGLILDEDGNIVMDE